MPEDSTVLKREKLLDIYRGTRAYDRYVQLQQKRPFVAFDPPCIQRKMGVGEEVLWMEAMAKDMWSGLYWTLLDMMEWTLSDAVADKEFVWKYRCQLNC